MAKSREVSVRELKNEATKILRRVEGGDTVTVTKRGRPIARIEPASDRPHPSSSSLYERLQ
ncbi:MAG: type II toxin-antitoxin system Phd/YefM family antitoxin, partial [Candidatus Binatia bacterium]